WRRPVNGRSLLAQPLPQTRLAELPTDLTAGERAWRVRLRHQRKQVAHDLYLLSRRVLIAKEPTLAWQILREVAYYDPDHERARGILGYQRSDDRWVTPFEARMIRDRQVWHDRFGWIPAADVQRYESGDRRFGKKWISADREVAIRQNFSHAWEVNTEHFLVKTNVSLERGVRIAQQLEDFHTFFQQTLPELFHSPDVLTRLFKSGSRRTSVRQPYEVHFFRTHGEYMQRLKKENPQIAITNGIYMPDHKVSYFYDNRETNTESTLYHEATHQILYQLHPQKRPIAEREHFWIIEGIACYMESYRNQNGRISIGNPESIRFQAARYRLLHESYQIPLARLAEMGKLAFQNDSRIAMNYSQSSGLTHFFMHYQEDRYRDALIEHIRRLYQAGPQRGRVAGLDMLTETGYTTLDRQYREYLAQQAMDLREQYPVPE
ncbi:MAG: DUF1570 domain-containing protein, partial [Planctomycetaceae bacterium]